MVSAKLVLSDGTVYKGEAFGACKTVSGETVFQTGMVGYPEALTDPSYSGQLLTLTFPMIGNYGAPPQTKDEYDLPLFYESDRIHAAALIVANLSEHYSHWNAAQSLGDWLKDQGITGISGIDTRALTKKLRIDGSMLGKIIVEPDTEESVEFYDPNVENLVAKVSTTAVKEFNKGGDVTIVAVDVGLKTNQLRCLISRGAHVKLVPWNHDLTSETYDGLFLSNGPGDPAMCDKTIENLKKLLPKETKPVFGICLGHQLISLAIGASTFKMPFGNRGHNQPATHTGTNRCFITSQNHGFAVDPETLPEDWEPLFVNENDQTNEGIIHKSKPFFSVQFHPESHAGPQDLELLFDVFLEKVRSKAGGSFERSIRKAVIGNGLEVGTPGIHPQKVIILGSGGLSIGQAGEFDYSGSQAMKALKEEHIQTVLINPNIATVQTMKGLANKVYFLPVTPEYVEKVIEFERPDGVLLSFGGQTALNCGVKLNESGVFEKYGVKVLGTPVEAIVQTEDREVFSQKLAEINERVCPNIACASVDEVLKAAEKIGFPVMMRSSFALGGLGSGVVENKEKLEEMAKVAFANTTQVMLERSLKGWKEVEYEVVRDAFDNTITVCNMENFDPLGVHTGESIVIAPSQTLSNDEYNLLRSVAIKVVRHFGIVGECNIQYALNPHSSEFFIIEVNARLSRSSALASKATGYPLAYVAAKLALNQSLATLRNSVTKKTTACFEPSLDYCVVKIPRWDLGKFPDVSKVLGTSMKSVGEVMAIGRNFEEAMQKALRMVDNGIEGFDPDVYEPTNDGLKFPTESRPLYVAAALAKDYTVDKIHELTDIDRWFLYKLKNIIDHGKKLKESNSDTLSKADLLTAKKLGFSDKQVAKYISSNELAVRKLRKTFKLRPFVKQIDTVAAEYPAYTNYLYLTYNGSDDDIEFEGGYTIVLGSGVYRIGSSVEFDYCAVGCIRELHRLGHKTIMVNYNPETVSTDYDECDRLYFDQLTFETVLDIYQMEEARGVIVAMGGQIANNIVGPLAREGVNIMGTSAEMIDSAENRYKFSRMCDSIQVDQPQWKELTSFEEAQKFCDEVSYPCLMRPSYVLSGTAMRVVHSATDLEEALKGAVVVSREFPCVISKFINDAKEIEVDAVANNGEIVIAAVSEHVENAGVHSGDATIVHPAQDLTERTMNGVRSIAARVAKALRITGPFNIQFIAKDDRLKVIECNVRCSRSFPFVSKTMDVDMIAIATRVMAGAPLGEVEKPVIDRVGVKVAQFSFNRLAGTDPTLGVDMISTGEVACFGNTREEAFLKAMLATSFTVPKKNILLSIGSYQGKVEFTKSAQMLEKLGYNLYGSLGTADFYNSHGVKITPVDWLSETEEMTGISNYLSDGKFDMLINLPMRNKYRRPASYTTSGQQTRRMAIDLRVPLITDIKVAKAFVSALNVYKGVSVSSVDCRTLSDVVRLPGLIDTFTAMHGDTNDWKSLSRRSVAGGFTSLCVFPAGQSTEVSREGKDASICDFTVFSLLADLQEDSDSYGRYLDMSQSEVSINEMIKLFEKSSKRMPLCVHAENHDLASILFFASMYKKPVHICGVKTIGEIKLIASAKDQQLPVTCSVSPLNLFASHDDKWNVTSKKDRMALWDHLAYIDVFATGQGLIPLDHSGTSEYVPAATLALPLLFNAVAKNLLTVEDIITRFHTNPIKIFGLQPQQDTEIEVVVSSDLSWEDVLSSEDKAVNPFSNRNLGARVSRVVVGGKLAYVDGQVVAEAGHGKESEEPTFLQPVTPQVQRKTPLPKSPQRSPRRISESQAADDSPADSDTELMEQNNTPATRVTFNTQHSIDSNMKPHRLKGMRIISVKQFVKDDLRQIFYIAHQFRLTTPMELLRGKVMASVFYEPSTRTQCSFTSAMQRLGGSVVSISQVSTSSVAKGETLEDTVRTMECYSDLTVLRHPEKGSLERAAAVVRKPLISCGDGTGEHPTQGLLDVFTIQEELGTVNGLTVAVVGDLLHGRTVHSLVKLLSLYRVKLCLVSPESLELPKKVVEHLERAGIPMTVHRTVEEILPEVDVLYMTRIQKERFSSPEAYDLVKSSFRLTPNLLRDAKKNMRVLHPLPRIDEISVEVDTDQRAAYFRQMEYGVYIRMALLAMVLGAV